jgi:hypothetical protein
MELYQKYSKRLAECEHRMDQGRQGRAQDSDDEEGLFLDTEASRYLRRLDEGGLYTLQRLAQVIGHVSAT